VTSWVTHFSPSDVQEYLDFALSDILLNRQPSAGGFIFEVSAARFSALSWLNRWHGTGRRYHAGMPSADGDPLDEIKPVANSFAAGSIFRFALSG
jgi:hypothetical protein